MSSSEMNCTHSSISNHTDGFDFGKLYAVYLYMNQTCSPESQIFYQHTRLFTDAACLAITRTSASPWKGWTAYPVPDIWARIVTWKIPLFQLLSLFPRPPLGWKVEVATLAHLLGDPIDSLMSMILTLALCSSRAKRAKFVCKEARILPSGEDYERTWKALAMIMISYDECGKSDEDPHLKDDL